MQINPGSNKRHVRNGDCAIGGGTSTHFTAHPDSRVAEMQAELEQSLRADLSPQQTARVRLNPNFVMISTAAAACWLAIGGTIWAVVALVG